MTLCASSTALADTPPASAGNVSEVANMPEVDNSSASERQMIFPPDIWPANYIDRIDVDEGMPAHCAFKIFDGGGSANVHLQYFEGVDGTFLPGNIRVIRHDDTLNVFFNNVGYTDGTVGIIIIDAVISNPSGSKLARMKIWVHPIE